MLTRALVDDDEDEKSLQVNRWVFIVRYGHDPGEEGLRRFENDECNDFLSSHLRWTVPNLATAQFSVQHGISDMGSDMC